MSREDGTMDYYLKTPVSFPVGGRLEEFSHLHFNEYKNGSRKAHFKIRKVIASLLGYFEKNAKHNQSDVKKDVKVESEVDAMSEALTIGFDMADGVDADEFLTAFEDMVIKNGLCLVDGKHVIKDAWNDINEDEQLEIAVKYVCFFGIGLLSALTDGSAGASTSHSQAKAL